MYKVHRSSILFQFARIKLDCNHYSYNRIQLDEESSFSYVDATRIITGIHFLILVEFAALVHL